MPEVPLAPARVMWPRIGRYVARGADWALLAIDLYGLYEWYRTSPTTQDPSTGTYPGLFGSPTGFPDLCCDIPKPDPGLGWVVALNTSSFCGGCPDFAPPGGPADHFEWGEDIVMPYPVGGIYIGPWDAFFDGRTRYNVEQNWVRGNLGPLPEGTPFPYQPFAPPYVLPQFESPPAPVVSPMAPPQPLPELAPLPGERQLPRPAPRRLPKCGPGYSLAFNVLTGEWGCHAQKRPKRGDKEKKGKSPLKGSIAEHAGNLMGAISEISDAVNSIINSMPRNAKGHRPCRTGGVNSLGSRLACLAYNYKKIDIPTAILNIIEDEAKDRAIAMVHRGANKSLLSTGYYVRPVGTSFGERYSRHGLGVPDKYIPHRHPYN